MVTPRYDLVQRLTLNYGADIDVKEFVRLYWHRQGGSKVKTPKAMDAGFAAGHSDDERKIMALIDEFNAQEVGKLESELFKQRKRLADAERTLQTQTTKAATDSKRIATDKIAWAMGKLSDFRRSELKDRDSRIFPAHYAPVMVAENGHRVIKPMRYQCRLAGKPGRVQL